MTEATLEQLVELMQPEDWVDEHEAEAIADMEIADLRARLAEVEDFRKQAAHLCDLRARYDIIAALATPEPEVVATNGNAERKAKIYGMPRNPFLRFLEFDDGSHGVLRVKKNHPCKVGWKVDVKAEAGRPNLYLLAGRYNQWGVRRD